jgi:chemotaxis protein methyltransferase CheR
VLIYFDAVSGAKVMENLHQIMRHGAFIFLGASESVGRLSNLFQMVRLGKHFVYRKA